uniref:Uncharacterized protein n=1 Tax=Timema poppense TaxID=170557 RepID=A0A7R9DAN7_TIMPO|nr:unnamed protein product [Timema poppensis]
MTGVFEGGCVSSSSEEYSGGGTGSGAVPGLSIMCSFPLGSPRLYGRGNDSLFLPSSLLKQLFTWDPLSGLNKADVPPGASCAVGSVSALVGTSAQVVWLISLMSGMGRWRRARGLGILSLDWEGLLSFSLSADSTSVGSSSGDHDKIGEFVLPPGPMLYISHDQKVGILRVPLLRHLISSWNLPTLMLMVQLPVMYSSVSFLRLPLHARIPRTIQMRSAAHLRRDIRINSVCNGRASKTVNRSSAAQPVNQADKPVFEARHLTRVLKQ